MLFSPHTSPLPRTSHFARFKPPRKVQINKTNGGGKKEGRALAPRPPRPARQPPRPTPQDCRPSNAVALNPREQSPGVESKGVCAQAVHLHFPARQERAPLWAADSHLEHNDERTDNCLKPPAQPRHPRGRRRLDSPHAVSLQAAGVSCSRTSARSWAEGGQRWHASPRILQTSPSLPPSLHRNAKRLCSPDPAFLHPVEGDEAPCQGPVTVPVTER